MAATTKGKLMHGQLCVVLSALARHLSAYPHDDLATACDAVSAALDRPLSFAHRGQIAAVIAAAVQVETSGDPNRSLADWLKEQRLLGRRHALRDATLRARRATEDERSTVVAGAR